MTPRDYQYTTIQQARDYIRQGTKRLLICSPTGSGKTAIMVFMIKGALQRGLTSMFNVHRRELLNQSVAAFKSQGINPAIVASGKFFDYRPKVRVCSVPTLGRRLNKNMKADFMIWDECHHIAAATWKKIYEHYKDAIHIGLTATPNRFDGRPLNEYFDAMIMGPTPRELIDQGWLCDYQAYVPNIPDLPNERAFGDYKKKMLEEKMDRKLVGDAVDHYQRIAKGTSAIAFCVSVAHSISTRDQFRAAGIEAAHIDGTTPEHERDQLIRDFRDKKIKVLCNVDLFGEGFDLPLLETVIMLRPTMSKALYLQQVGRALRPSPGKDRAIILDHAGNIARHQLPDAPQEWSLNGRVTNKKKEQDTGPSIRICKSCFGAQAVGGPFCKICGDPFPVKRRTIEQEEGSLVQVDKVADFTQSPLDKKTKFSYWMRVGMARGFTKGKAYMWAKHMAYMHSRGKV